MYPSKGGGGGGGYAGQQTYGAQQAYSQHPGSGFSNNPAAGTEMGAQHGMASRQNSMMGMSQEADASRFRAHPTQTAQYGGPYASVYGSAALSGGQQVGGSNKGAASSSLQSRPAYPSSLTDSSKYSAGAMGSGYSDDYLSASNRGYAQRGEQFSGAKNSDYAIDRRAYGEGSYAGRDLQSDQARRYADSTSLSHQHQTDLPDHMDQASLLRQQQILKAQSLHAGPDIRQAEYLAARAAPIHPGSQEYSSYGGGMDVDPHGLPIISSSQYGAPHSASILGAPRRNYDDLIYTQGSNAGYGVSLPPGRDYISGKVLLGSTGSEYQGSIISRDHLNLGVPAIIERKDDRDAYRRELDIREEERRRDMLREREREKERERDRERERERERERDRRERERERERDHRRALDSKRERTPSRASRDRRASSAKKDERSRHASPRRSPLPRSVPRRVSPRREAAHRHRSPVKEKKRDYVCKVQPFCLVEAERDYLSVNKRYPRLSITPEFTKVVLKWPKENLNLSLHTPVSFEHDFVEDNKSEETSLAPVEDSAKNTNIVWNAKILLMSGVSSDALDEFCSDKSSDDRLVHFNNFLRFAILKKDHSFVAIGGQWKEALDGAEPLIDGSSLIQTAKRYVKDVTQLDLQNCQHWNPFLEIHYNRIGDDGLSSYKEITVLFVPNLLDCLPTLHSWRSMWLAHRKEVVEREKELASKKEKKSSEKESMQGDHGSSKSKKSATATKTGKVDDRSSKDEKIGKAEDKSSKVEKISKGAESKDEGGDSKNGSEQKQKLPELLENLTEKNAQAMVVDDKTNEKKALDLSSSDPNEVKKPAKKKIIRKVVRGKTADKKETLVTDETVAKQDDKSEKDSEKKQKDQEVIALVNDSFAEPEKVKTFVRKRVVRKTATGKSSQEEDNNVVEKKLEQDIKNMEGKVKNDEGPAVDAAQQTAVGKVAAKKRIIRRVIKKKVVPTEDKPGVTLANDGVLGENNISVVKAIKEVDLPVVKAEQGPAESSPTENKAKEEIKKLAIDKDGASEKKITEATDNKKLIKTEKVPKTEKHVSSNSELEVPKQNDSEKDLRKGEGSRHDKEKKGKNAKEKDAKHDSRNKSSKETKEKVKSDEPPKQPGLFLKTKRTKESKVRSLSLSLAGLLEYNDKDTEESTFELSLFAESFNEMLQYQMGCRILSFLEKLRKRFVIKHKQRKRQREEKKEKEIEAEAASRKRPKISDKSPAEKEPVKPGTQDSKDQNHDENHSRNAEAIEADKSDREKKSDVDEANEEEEEEELEEMYEEYEEVEEAATASDVVMEVDEGAAEEVDTKPKSEVPSKDDQGKESASEKNTNEIETKDNEQSNSGSKDEKKPSTEKSDSVKEFVDKELLQAFRFFDYNKVGYIKMDDLRCLLHDLGKFLSHRDVKELVQSALYESSSARDDRIFYKKLVRIRDL